MKNAGAYFGLLLALATVAYSGSPSRLRVPEETTWTAEILAPTAKNRVAAPGRAAISAPTDWTAHLATDTVGMTTYDWQYNACVVRRVVFDPENRSGHFVWSHSNSCDDPPFSDRRVHYNHRDRAGAWLHPGGLPVTDHRSGQPSLDLNSSGSAVIALRRQLPQELPHVSVAVDSHPGSGVFNMRDLGGGLSSSAWPKIAVDSADNMVVIVQGGDGCYYTVSTDGGVSWSAWTFLDSTSMAHNSSASKRSEKMVLLWSREIGSDNYNGHLYYQLSTDGGASWGRPVDVTAHIERPSGNCYEWWQMRSAHWGGYGLFDLTDEVNVVFEASMHPNSCGLYFRWLATVIFYYNPHIGVSPVALYTHPWVFAFSQTHANTQLAGKPSIGQDPVTGYLYCVWLEYPYDQNDATNPSFPVAELYAARSMDDGVTWGPKVNLTVSPELNEVFPSLAPMVDDSLHVFYECDLQSGSYVHGNGECTENPMFYAKVPVIDGNIEVVSIDAPPHVPDHTTWSDSTYTPKATYRNGGSEQVTFQARFEITTPGVILLNEEADTLFVPISLQYGTVEVANLLPGETTQVTFPAWTCSTWMSGRWVHYTSSACLLGDEDISDNVRVDSCIVDSLCVRVEEMPMVDRELGPALFRSYPNPVRDVSTIYYQSHKPGRTRLRIYDLAGKLVRTLVDGVEQPGHHSVQWNGTDETGRRVPSGVYFYQLQADSDTTTRKLIVLGSGLQS